VTPLSRPLLDEITLGAAAVAVIALLVALLAHLRARRLRRTLQTLDGPEGRESVLQAVGRVQDEAAALRAEVAAARSQVSTAQADLAAALRHVAVVRYDAFGDMGGRMSFTAALLDDSGDGLVISSINGRTEGRSYAKGIKAGRGDASLSPEEEQAVSLAMKGSAAAPRDRG
jgi:hypothetical protein